MAECEGKKWDRLLPLPKDGALAVDWIRSCWPNGVRLAGDFCYPFLLCADHFASAGGGRLCGVPSLFGKRISGSVSCCGAVDCSDQIVSLIISSNRGLSEDPLSRTGSLLLFAEADELSESQRGCAHYAVESVGSAVAGPVLSDMVNQLGVLGGAPPPPPPPPHGDEPYGGFLAPMEGWGEFECVDGSRFEADGARLMLRDYEAAAAAAAGGGGGGGGAFSVAGAAAAACELTLFDPPHPPHHPHHDPRGAACKPICKHGFFADGCLICGDKPPRSTASSSSQNLVMNCVRPQPGPKASIPFLEPAFREQIHNPFEGCGALPSLKPGAVRTREEGLETQLEVCYRSILKKYYSNKWSRKSTGFRSAKRFDNARVQCNVCHALLDDNLSIAGHLCAHLEDFAVQSEEQMQLKLMDANAVPITSPDPYAAALARTCTYCPTEMTFDTPFEFILHLDLVHIHEIKQYRCRICEQSHRNLLELACHLNLCHCGTELPYRCETCGYRTSFYADMMFHYVRFHRNEDTFYCPFCLQSVELKTISTHSKGGRKGDRSDHNQHQLFLDSSAAYEHLLLHYDRTEGNRQSTTKYKFCRKCVLHLKAIKDHMKGDHLNIVAGAKASYMSSTDDEEYASQEFIQATPFESADVLAVRKNATEQKAEKARTTTSRITPTLDRKVINAPTQAFDAASMFAGIGGGGGGGGGASPATSNTQELIDDDEADDPSFSLSTSRRRTTTPRSRRRSSRRTNTKSFTAMDDDEDYLRF